MSLDGFIAGPDDEVDRLHDWGFGGKTEVDTAILNTAIETTGAVVLVYVEGSTTDALAREGS
jgi:hypothetical protein